MSEALERIAAQLHRARRLVVMTGAGASAESGIPTFRDALTGLWARFRAEELATPEAFEAHPERVSQWYESRRQAALACQPNGGHQALAQLQDWAEARGCDFTLVTQNVDGLHQRAGSRNVLELHGSLLRWRGWESGVPTVLPETGVERFPVRSETGELLRPGVVWFGEPLPEATLAAALQATAAADAFMSIGTSSVVYPAAGLIEIAIESGAYTVEVNPEQTPFTGRVDQVVAQASTPCLQALVSRL